MVNIAQPREVIRRKLEGPDNDDGKAEEWEDVPADD